MVDNIRLVWSLQRELKGGELRYSCRSTYVKPVCEWAKNLPWFIISQVHNCKKALSLKMDELWRAHASGFLHLVQLQKVEHAPKLSEEMFTQKGVLSMQLKTMFIDLVLLIMSTLIWAILCRDTTARTIRRTFEFVIEIPHQLESAWFWIHCSWSSLMSFSIEWERWVSGTELGAITIGFEFNNPCSWISSPYNYHP